MTKVDLLNEIRTIAEDCYWSAGCSHEDVLQDALREAHQQLQTLVKEIEKEGIKQ